MIISIPSRLLAALRAQEAAKQQMLQGWLLTLDYPDKTRVELNLDEGLVNLPDPQQDLEADIERFLKPVDN